MRPSILLLDCSSALAQKLKRQGFDVNSGTIGFCTGTRHLPCQVYERDIFIYSPSFFARNNRGGYIAPENIRDVTPEYSLNYLPEHFLRGATFLVFINRVADEEDKQNQAYEWIPFMPKLHFTKDSIVLLGENLDTSKYKYLAPLLYGRKLKVPVLQKINTGEVISQLLSLKEEKKEFDFSPLFFNRNQDFLSIFLKIKKGRLIILPEYQSNEEIIDIFLNRVAPKIYKFSTKSTIIEQFLSPEEREVQQEKKKLKDRIEKLEDTLEKINERLVSAKRQKIKTIENDETARLILNYYKTALRQEDVALFFLYKAIEALEKKYGGKSRAKNTLGCNAEWNLIRRLANASYADIRHAPKPGEKIKEWSQEEIERCFKAAEKIIYTYLATLF